MPASLDVTTLENIAAHGWQGTSSARVGEWFLRDDGGFTGRANSVLPLGSPGCDLDAALHQIADFYVGHRLPAKFAVPLDETGPALYELDHELQIQGWWPFDLSVVVITSLATRLDACPPSATLPAASLESAHPVGSPGGDHAAVGRGVVTDRWLGVTAVTLLLAGPE